MKGKRKTNTNCQVKRNYLDYISEKFLAVCYGWQLLLALLGGLPGCVFLIVVL